MGITGSGRRGLSPNERLANLKTRPLALAERLFAGFEPDPAVELEAMATDTSLVRVERSCAAWALARWRAMKGEPEAALRFLAVMHRNAPVEAAMIEPTVLRIDALIATGRTDAAIDTALESTRRLPGVSDVELMASSAFAAAGDIAGQFDWLNRSFARNGLRPIATSAAGPPTLSTIRVAGTTPVEASAGTISVLMPARNASGTIRFAIASILGQTYRDLELIVVDDGSEDDTGAIVAEFAGADPRVRMLRHARTGGAYAARNTALAAATGTFVTCHDADDWSHPQKLERQVAMLGDSPGSRTISAAALVSDTLRCLRFPLRQVLTPNFSSLTARREDLAAIGGWDDVRASADGELIDRFKARFGGNAGAVCPDTPLSLLSTSQGSLTRDSATGLASLRYGARREYRQAYRHWHKRESRKAAPDFSLPREVRPFPVPQILRPGEDRAGGRYDLLVVADYSRPAVLATALWSEAARHGRRFAWLHIPRIDFIAPPVAEHVRDLAVHLAATPVVAGEAVSVATVVATDPLSLMLVHPGLCAIRGDRGMLVSGGDVPPHEFHVAHRNFEAMFGVAPRPVSSVKPDLLFNPARGQT